MPGMSEWLIILLIVVIVFGATRARASVLLWREDLGAWMEEATRRSERSAWLAAWNAGPARVAHCLQQCLAVGVAGGE